MAKVSQPSCLRLEGENFLSDLRKVEKEDGETILKKVSEFEKIPSGIIIRLEKGTSKFVILEFESIKVRILLSSR